VPPDDDGELLVGPILAGGLAEIAKRNRKADRDLDGLSFIASPRSSSVSWSICASERRIETCVSPGSTKTSTAQPAARQASAVAHAQRRLALTARQTRLSNRLPDSPAD